MLIDLLFGALCALLWLPLVTGYCAYSHGRSFWLWFTLGLLLPGLSFVALLGLLWQEQRNPGHRLLQEARRILAEAELHEVEPYE